METQPSDLGCLGTLAGPLAFGVTYVISFVSGSTSEEAFLHGYCAGFLVGSSGAGFLYGLGKCFFQPNEENRELGENIRNVVEENGD